MPRVIVYFAPNSTRSNIVAKALHQGIVRCGEDVELRSSMTFKQEPDSDIAIFYGLSSRLNLVLQKYRQAKKRALYVDLGYWGRRKRTRWDGHHKIVLNARHPTSYFQNREHPADRFAGLGLAITPWKDRTGEAIMIIGMSAKAAHAEGLKPEQWERQTANRLRTITRRPIIYRPKPNWPGARAIPGTTMQKDVALPQGLEGVHCIVTHHSNVAVDCMIWGVPAICLEGAASVICDSDLSCVENPRRPDSREQWARDLAYTQWSLEEMSNGTAWRMLGEEGLLG